MNMSLKALITGNSLMDLILYHSDVADEVMGISAITPVSRYEFGTLLLKRASESIEENETRKIIEVSKELLDAINHMDVVDVNRSQMETLFTIGVYKKIDFVQCTYLFAAKENNLVLIANEKEIQEAAKEIGVQILLTGSKNFEQKFRQLNESR